MGRQPQTYLISITVLDALNISDLKNQPAMKVICSNVVHVECDEENRDAFNSRFRTEQLTESIK